MTMRGYSGKDINAVLEVLITVTPLFNFLHTILKLESYTVDSINFESRSALKVSISVERISSLGDASHLLTLLYHTRIIIDSCFANSWICYTFSLSGNLSVSSIK